MGEIAEMMVNGEMCEGCGEWLLNEDMETENVGYPQYCSEYCAKNRGATWTQETKEPKKKKIIKTNKQ